MTILRMRCACWIPNAYKHTVIICTTYRFCTATIVARKRLNVTLYVHCLYCWFRDTDKVDTWTFYRNSLQHCCRTSYFSTKSLWLSTAFCHAWTRACILSRQSSLPPVQPLAHGIPQFIATGVKCLRRHFLTLRRLMSYIYIYIYIWSTHSWCF